MKIFELHYSTSWAGAERFVIDLSNELSKENEIIFCTIEDDNIEKNAYYKKDLSPQIRYMGIVFRSV